jgi:UPF0042 nucleotide-binding protein
MNFVIVTGLSGAGKTRAINALEDIGFFCADNIPPKLISTFYDMSQQAQGTLSHVAIVTDIRGGDMFPLFLKTLDRMKAEYKKFKILFLDANNYILINRFQETRRKHPLTDSCLGSLEKAVKLERMMLRPIRERADYVIDTSNLSTAQLKERISSLFLGNASDAMRIQCISFGFKFGIPAEADLVFDVRCLPNPFYVDSLKHLTGLDKPVQDYVLKSSETKGFTDRLFSLVDYMIPLYCNEGKSQLVIAIGCTGGHHRSVTLTQVLYKHLLSQNLSVSVNHRDIRKE